MNIFKKKPTWKIIFVDPSRVRLETLNTAIQNLPIKKTNRYMQINKKKYFVVFDYDYDFGIVEDYKVNDGVTDTIYRQDVYIIEHSVTFLFDKDWNFIKKE